MGTFHAWKSAVSTTYERTGIISPDLELSGTYEQTGTIYTARVFTSNGWHHDLFTPFRLTAKCTELRVKQIRGRFVDMPRLVL